MGDVSERSLRSMALDLFISLRDDSLEFLLDTVV